jgi:hypothetical protein
VEPSSSPDETSQVDQEVRKPAHLSPQELAGYTDSSPGQAHTSAPAPTVEDNEKVTNSTSGIDQIKPTPTVGVVAAQTEQTDPNIETAVIVEAQGGDVSVVTSAESVTQEATIAKAPKGHINGVLSADRALEGALAFIAPNFEKSAHTLPRIDSSNTDQVWRPKNKEEIVPDKNYFRSPSRRPHPYRLLIPS